MPKMRHLPLANYSDGTYSIIRGLSNGLDGFEISIPRCNSAAFTIWPSPMGKLHIKVECSYDGGATFPADGGGAEATAEGGILVNRGEEVPETTLAFALPLNPRGTPNAVRITVTVTGGPIRAALDVAAN